MPRERRPALAALALLLILAGALTSTMLVMRSGDRVTALRVSRRVPAGTVIPADAVQQVQVAKDSGINYVLWAQRGALARYYAATDLVPGSILVGEMLSRKSRARAGQVVVGLSLKNGQFPAGLRVGDHVQAYAVGDAARGLDAGAPLVGDALVWDLPGNGDNPSGNQGVSIAVDQDAAAPLARAASAGNVALVLLPQGSAR